MGIHNDYFAFIGEHATTGQPNRLTGLHSRFGKTRRFKTKKDAEAFVEAADYAPIMVVGKILKIRQFHYGLTVEQMEEYFNCLDYEVVA